MKYIVFGIILCATLVICKNACVHQNTEKTCCDLDGCAYVNCTGETEMKCVNHTSLETLNCTGTSDVCQEAVTSIAPTGNVSSTIAPDVTSATEGPSTKGKNHTTIEPTTGADVTTTNASVTTDTASPTESNVTHHAGGTTDTTTDAMTTAAPSTSPSCPTGQHFDAASFIGGIVLCGGLLSIIFFGCKFYKARSEKNYHQF